MTLNYDLTGFPGATSPPIPPNPPVMPNLIRQQTTTTRQQGHTLAATHAHSGHGAAHRPIQPKKRVVAHHRPTPFGEKAF